MTRPRCAILCGCLLVAATVGAQTLPLRIVPSPTGTLPGLARGGIPVPGSAALRDAKTLKVVATGSQKEIPASIRILARRPGSPDKPGAARWIQLLIPHVPQEARGLVLTRRDPTVKDNLPALAPTGKPPVARGGALSVELGDGRPHLIRSLMRDGRTWPMNLRVTMLDEQGKALVFAPGKAVVEESSSAHLRLAWRGQLGPVLMATVRATLGAHVPWLHLDVRLENPRNLTEESTVYLRELAVVMQPGPRLPSGLDGTTLHDLPFVVNIHASKPPRPGRGRVLKWSLYRDKRAVRGVEHGGVVAVSDGKHSLYVGNRHAARENPTRFTLTPNRVTVHLLPEGGSGPHHRGRWGDPTKNAGPIDPRSRRAFRFEGSRWKTFTLGFLPTGGTPSKEDAAALQSALEMPPLIVTPRSTLAARPGILIPTWSREAPSASERRFRRLLRVLAYDSASDPQLALGRIGLPAFLARGGTYGGWNPYGWFNFGDVTWSEGYCSLHYDLPRTLFASWLASRGDRAFFDMGANMARHLRDIDYVHGGDTASGRGAQRYEKGWWHGNAFPPMESHTWVTGLQLHYLLTGDIGCAETLDENAAWLLDLDLENWTGLWGARRIGWPIDALVSHWMQAGDPKFLRKIRALIAAFERNEKTWGSKGYVLNRGWGMENKRIPARHQSWMHAIVLAAVSRYVYETGDRTSLPLVRRMARHLVSECYIPPRRKGPAYTPAMTWEFWAPGGYRQKQSVHLTWVLLDALSRAALVLDDRDLLATSTEIFESITRFFQWDGKRRLAHPDRPGTYSPITARMTMYPGSESKILSNIGRFGMSYLAVRRLMTQ